MNKSAHKKFSLLLTLLLSVLFLPVVSYASGDADTIYYSVDAGDTVTFDGDDFNDVCVDWNDEDADLDYVIFELPDSDDGTLYYDYDGDDESYVDDSDEYYYDDDPDISDVTLVPEEDFSGTVTIRYEGYDTDGYSFFGDIVIEVEDPDDDSDLDTADTIYFTGYAGSEIPFISSYFNDVNGSYGWAADYVDSLYTAGILTGETAADNTRIFRPSDGITRGDFLLILSRAFNFQTGASEDNFSDVAAGAYYADAVAAAKAVGIAQGSGSQFYPEASITREDAMVLVLRAMNVAGVSVTAGTASELTAYADNGTISDYAQEAVATLVKSGIITGNDENRILPGSKITRAEAAAVIYRIKN